MSDVEERGGAHETPFFVISIAARLVNVHQQTLRYYERLGLIEPGRSKGNIRLYSMKDVRRAQQIRRLIEELGVNLAGVEVILNMSDRMMEMEQRLTLVQHEYERIRDEYEAEIARLRALLGRRR
ncbi:MAG TPA: MerR family transcriptional regulator [Chloroflexota bacterium]